LPRERRGSVICRISIKKASKDWARILAFVAGMVDRELLARIEYLATENRILKRRYEMD
jgi:hypothetical protein